MRVCHYLAKPAYPNKEDPEAFLICDPVSAKQISPDKLRSWIYDLRDKIKEKLAAGVITDPRKRAMLEERVSKRKWNPYCLGRHSAISWWTDHEREGTVKKLAGLSKTIKRLQTYRDRK